MTTLSDTPGEGLDQKALDLVCVEWPHMPRDVLSEIVDDYLAASRSPSFASDTAALPSGYEGLVEAVARRIFNDEHEGLQNCYDWDSHGLEGEHPGTRERYYGYAESAVSEVIAALGRVQPVAWHGTWQTRTSKWTEVFETEAQATNWAISKEGAVINPLFFSAKRFKGE